MALIAEFACSAISTSMKYGTGEGTNEAFRDRSALGRTHVS